MQIKLKEFVAFALKKNYSIKDLVPEAMQDKLKITMNDVVQVICLTRSNPSRPRIFLVDAEGEGV